MTESTECKSRLDTYLENIDETYTLEQTKIKTYTPEQLKSILEEIKVHDKLGEILFDNPCIGCQNLHKSIVPLPIKDYQQLCLTHRDVYDRELCLS